METNALQGGRLSVEKDDTVHDIWRYTQVQRQQGASFDPSSMNKAVDMQRQLRKENRTRPSERFSLGKLLNADSPEVRGEEVSRAMKRRTTNINLQKSLALLDDAVGTPVPLLRSSKKTPSALRRAMTPKAGGSIDKFDLSSSMAPSTPGYSMMATPGTTMMSVDDMNLTGFSGSYRPHTTSSVLGQETIARARYGSPIMNSDSESMMEQEVAEDVTNSNVALLLEDDPGLAASTSVFGEFGDILQSHVTEDQVFDMVAEYEKICSSQVDLLKKFVDRAAPSKSKYAKVKSTLGQLTGEKHTWRLIATLYKDRLETEIRGETEEAMMLDNIGKHISDKKIMGTLYEKESNIRQAQLVVDWLERNAEEKLDNYYDRVEFFTNQTGAWENSLHHLQQRKEGIPLHSDRVFVDQLDPDAPIRQQRPLADLDQEDEVRLLQFVFACIRAGQLDEAQKLCSKCGQAWRAATLEGWRLYHDPNYDSDSSTLVPVEGNPYRDIWKMACWRLSEDERFHRVERAIYAGLSGNLKQLLPACEVWADTLWAYFKCMVDTRVEQEIRIQTTADRPPEQLPSNYWDKPMSMDSIFREIQASPNEKIKAESRQKFETIQKYIILGDIDALLEECCDWVKEDNNLPPRHILRFMAHLVLFFRTIGLNTKEELCINLLEAYIRSLIQDQRRELVAIFVAKLPQPLQVDWYARFLEGIRDTEERHKCLLLAEEALLNVPSITKRVVENIRTRDHPEFSLEVDIPLDTAITDEDCQKIEAIEWLVFDPGQRSEAIRQANAVMRTFLALKKQSAARAVFTKIPPGSIDVVVRNWQKQTGSTELSAEDDNTIREYLCIQAYLDAQDSFNDWFDHYHKAKPTAPEIAVGASFTERVANEHKEKQYQAELDRWRHSLMLQSKTTVEKIYNVLLFVDGGWMADQRMEASADEGRRQQMVLLRQMCLPDLCFLLHTVLHSTAQQKECLQLADMLASEQHQLYSVFTRDELRKFLQRLQESAVELLNKSSDPIGYEL